MNDIFARSKVVEKAGAKRRPNRKRQRRCRALVGRSVAGQDHARWWSVALFREVTRGFRQCVSDPPKLYAYNLPMWLLTRMQFCMILIVVIVMVRVTLAGFLEIMVPALMNTMSSLQVLAVTSRFVMMVQA